MTGYHGLEMMMNMETAKRRFGAAQKTLSFSERKMHPISTDPLSVGAVAFQEDLAGKALAIPSAALKTLSDEDYFTDHFRP